MRCVHRTSNRTFAQLLRGALETEGVASMVLGEHLTPLQGEVAAGAAAEYRLCILDDDQWTRASRLVAQWLEEPRGPVKVWECHGCGERHEPQFGACWKCGAEAEVA